MKRILSILGLVLLLFQACEYHDDDDDDWFRFRSDPVIGSGVVTEEVRSLPPFDSVDLRAEANVSVIEGGSQNLRIRTDDNILAHVLTRVAGGVLLIESDTDYDSDYGVEIAIDMIDVQVLQLTGVGAITAANIDSAGNVRADLYGVGSISLSGTTDTFDGTNAGLGDLDAEHLVSRRSTILASGTGDSRTTATDELWVTLSGVGNVYYGGNPPVVRSNITGLGRLIPI